MTLEKIIELIDNSTVLSKDQKDASLEDIDWMQNSIHYAEMVGFDKNETEYTELAEVFIFENSYLGLEFWKIINDWFNTYVYNQNDPAFSGK